MNKDSLLVGLIYYFISCIILYFLLPKLKLKPLEWIAETSKRRIISFIIFIILSGLIGGLYLI